MNRSTLLGCVAALSLAVAFAVPSCSAAEQNGPRPKVQMAILLDTSSSMTGLIDQARLHLWKVVNQFIDAKLGDQLPELEVALLEFGAGRLEAQANYTRLAVPFTSNLDQVSEELMSLTAVGRPGGSLEYCGQIIKMAVEELEWDHNAKGLKCIFIAGNESFAQGPIHYRDACRAAADKNITVSTIFCGNYDEGKRLQWDQGASLTDGKYLCINHNQVVHVERTPHDEKLAELNSRLNNTYLAYGSQPTRAAAITRQQNQDATAAELASSAIAERARFKGSELYRNESWDLVDGVISGKVKLQDLKEEELPEPLRKVASKDRLAHVEKLAKQRKQIQQEIAAVSEKRDKFLSEIQKDKQPTADSDLADALLEAVREEAAKQQIELKK